MKLEWNKNLAIRAIWMVLGVVLIGLGSSLFRLSGFGTDPFACMNLGVSSVIGISYGNYQLILNVVLLIPMLLWYRKAIGLGTVINMIFVGYVSDFHVYIWKNFGVTADTLESIFIVRVILMLVGVVLLCIGVAFYMECEMGIAPYDALGPMIEMGTNGKIKFSIARIITDVISVGIGFVTGSVIGVSTLVTAFFTGPLVSFFREHAAKKVLHKS